MPVAKQQIRQIIAENDINSVADVYTLLKDSFKDILQELMEAELDATLGYQKNQKGGGIHHKCELKQAILVKLLYGTRYSGFFGTVFFLTNNVNTFYL